MKMFELRRIVRPIVNASFVPNYFSHGFIVLRSSDVIVFDNGEEVMFDEMSIVGRAISDHATKYPQYFSVVENGLIFDSEHPIKATPQTSQGTYDRLNVSARGLDYTSVFRYVALYSNLPQIVAELMELDPETQKPSRLTAR